MNKMISRALLALSLTAPAIATAGAAFNTVTIEDARARAVPKVAPASGAFMTLHNRDSVDHVVVAAESDVARAVELHTHTNDNGVMRMRKIDSIRVPAGDSVMLKPGGLHVMLIGLNRDMHDGDTFSLTLVFDDGSRVALDVPVQHINRQGHMNHDNHGGHEGHMMHKH